MGGNSEQQPDEVHASLLTSHLSCARLSPFRLRETLLEALSGAAPTAIDMDSPADKALRLIDKILCGDMVGGQERGKGGGSASCEGGQGSGKQRRMECRLQSR